MRSRLYHIGVRIKVLSHNPNSNTTISIGEYWIVNQILSKGLHTGDAETLQYTTNLMEKLERV